VHKKFYPQVKQIRSLTLNSWNEKQLRMMTLGGNRNLRAYLSEYSLLETPVDARYKSAACDYYSKMLRA
jgi:hypothetical protein